MTKGVDFSVNAANVPAQPINYGHRQDLALLLRLGLLGLSAGTLLRAGKAVKDTVTQPEEKPSPYQVRPLEVPIQRSKLAAGPTPTVTEQLAQRIGDAVGLFSPGDKIRKGLGGFLASDTATGPTGKIWFNALAAPAAVGGAYGGYKLTDWLADKQRETNLDQDLEDAKAEYEAAVAGSSKTASIDQLYDAVSPKLANITDTAKGALGAYLGALALLGTGSAAMTYSWGRQGSRAKLLDEAIKQRERERYAVAPPPIMAIPREMSAAVSAA